jgi:hypothetical protein
VIITREKKMTNSKSRADYDAELREWCFHGEGQFTVAFGRVFGDRKQRWPDGYAISTSTVMSGLREEGAVITTRNTRYLLSGPAGDHDAML